MSKENVALYTKYRPKKFKEVLGQEHVTSVLEEAIKLGNLTHAYLFSGSRGIGKTSIARIFASEIGTTSNDLYEIDAASNTSVENIRDLNESVNTLPFDSKYKVYILDEVHMLSKSAFNALLKTLEEPPEHVIFILATTEPEKIPETVISRCESYTFKKPNQTILKDMIVSLAKKEGVTLEPASADLIALLGDGSFRDTVGVLQKIIHSSKDTKISIEEVQKVTGAPKSALVNAYIEALHEKSIEKGMGAIAEASEQNIDMKVYTKLILMKLRGILLLRFAAKEKKRLEDMFGDEITFLETYAKEGTMTLTSETLKRLLEAYAEVTFSHIPQLPLELALIDLVGKDAPAA